MSLAQMTAAPSEIKLGDKTYRLSPLRDMDFGEFERWVQDRYMDVALRNLKGLDESDRATLIKAAYATAAGITSSSPEALQIMTTVDGAAKLLWLSLRREQPQITQDEAYQIATDPRTVTLCMERIRELNRINDDDEAVKKKTKTRPPKPSGAKMSIGCWLKRIISRRSRLPQ